MKIKGFTLIELMITLVIISILLAIGLPSFKGTIAKGKLETEANNLFRDLNFARTEAIKQGNSVSLCSSSNGTSCNGNDDYSNGWLVFLDTSEDGSVDADKSIIRVVEGPAGEITIKGTSSINFICYSSTGLLC